MYTLVCAALCAVRCNQVLLRRNQFMLNIAYVAPTARTGGRKLACMSISSENMNLVPMSVAADVAAAVASVARRRRHDGAESGFIFLAPHNTCSKLQFYNYKG
jgi:hypothetical protein